MIAFALSVVAFLFLAYLAVMGLAVIAGVWATFVDNVIDAPRD